MLALSKVNKVSTIGGRLQKTTKWVKDYAPNLAKASAHWLTSRQAWITRLFGICFTSFFYNIYLFIYLIVVWSGENSTSNIFLSGCANENFKENGENPFYFYEFYKVQTTRLLAKPRSLACMDKEKLLYSENCLLYLGFFGGSYFQWLCGLVEWQ